MDTRPDVLQTCERNNSGQVRHEKILKHTKVFNNRWMTPSASMTRRNIHASVDIILLNEMHLSKIRLLFANGIMSGSSLCPCTFPSTVDI